VRRKPYTDIGIRRVPCFCCGAPSETQWNICADGNVFRGLCLPCDVALNDAVLRFMGDPDRTAKIAAYARKKGVTL
jgi:hypothetical protein